MELRKSTKLPQTPELQKNAQMEYLKPTKNTPVHEFGSTSKYSPTSFTKVKADPLPPTPNCNKSFVV